MKYTIFGESHGPAIGVTLTGVPAGLELDWDFIRSEMARRAPGKNALSTARKETDEPKILSGVFEGKTTGSPKRMGEPLFLSDRRVRPPAVRPRATSVFPDRRRFFFALKRPQPLIPFCSAWVEPACL